MISMKSPVVFAIILSWLVSSCVMSTPDYKAIVSAPLPGDRESPDPVLEKYIALINNNDYPTPNHRKEYLMILGDRFAHIEAARDMEDYGRYKYGPNYIFQAVREGEDSIVIKPAYLVAKHPESIPVEKRVNFTPFRLNRREARSYFIKK